MTSIDKEDATYEDAIVLPEQLKKVLYIVQVESEELNEVDGFN